MIGNSGNSTEPHLHFQVTKGPGPLDAAGIPYVIDAFEQSGEVQDIEKFMQLAESPKSLQVAPSKYDGKHAMQLPREATVVKFPE